MKVSKILSFAALATSAVQGAPVTEGITDIALSSVDVLKRAEPAADLSRRGSGLDNALGTVFAGLDDVVGTVGLQIDKLLGTFFAGGINAQEAADAIATLLNNSQAFADALATILDALKS